MRAVATLLLTVLLGVSCLSEKVRAARTVRSYDEALVIAFRTGDLAPLKMTAAPGEVRKVEALVDLKKSAGLVLESQIETLEVDKTEALSTEGMLVETTERWRYYDRATRPGTVAGPRFLARMRMRYELQQQDGRWRVLKVRTLTNDILDPPGFGRQANQHATGGPK